MYLFCIYNNINRVITILCFYVSMEFVEENEKYDVIISNSTEYPGHVIEKWTRQGHLHRVGKPALMVRDEHGIEVLSQFYSWGRLHRDDGPASVLISGTTRCAEWYAWGVRSRLDGPAIIHQNINSGVVMLERYIYENQIHRTRGPAFTYRNSRSGQVLHELFYKRGTLHRLKGPASIEYDQSSGSVISTSYYKNGLLHRDRGLPAVQKFDAVSGEEFEKYYYVNGVEQPNLDHVKPEKPSPD